jgi:hypothetical protein
MYLNQVGVLNRLACANPYLPSYTYNEILVVNNAYELISNMAIKVENISGYRIPIY